MRTPEEIAIDLAPMERERLTGWSGSAGAAYNAISSYLSVEGMLTAQWELTPLGEQVKAECLKLNGENT